MKRLILLILLLNTSTTFCTVTINKSKDTYDVGKDGCVDQ